MFSRKNDDTDLGGNYRMLPNGLISSRYEPGSLWPAPGSSCVPRWFPKNPGSWC